MAAAKMSIIQRLSTKQASFETMPLSMILHPAFTKEQIFFNQVGDGLYLLVRALDGNFYRISFSVGEDSIDQALSDNTCLFVGMKVFKKNASPAFELPGNKSPAFRRFLAMYHERLVEAGVARPEDDIRIGSCVPNGGRHHDGDRVYLYQSETSPPIQTFGVRNEKGDLIPSEETAAEHSDAALSDPSRIMPTLVETEKGSGKWTVPEDAPEPIIYPAAVTIGIGAIRLGPDGMIMKNISHDAKKKGIEPKFFNVPAYMNLCILSKDPVEISGNKRGMIKAAKKGLFVVEPAAGATATAAATDADPTQAPAPASFIPEEDPAVDDDEMMALAEAMDEEGAGSEPAAAAKPSGSGVAKREREQADDEDGDVEFDDMDDDAVADDDADANDSGGDDDGGDDDEDDEDEEAKIMARLAELKKQKKAKSKGAKASGKKRTKIEG